MTTRSIKARSSGCIFALACALATAIPSARANDRQDLAQLQRVVENYVRREIAGLPGSAAFTVQPFDSRLSLPRCAAPEAFLAPGARLWGVSSVGVRCAAPTAWSVYAAVMVEIQSEYLVTARPIAQGEIVTPADFTALRGDLTKLPAGIVVDPAHAVGKQAALSLAPGQPLRRDMLRAPTVVTQGQTVRLVTQGPGFRVSAEGRALANAHDGQMVQVRAASGSTVSGLARAGGIVEVRY